MVPYPCMHKIFSFLREEFLDVMLYDLNSIITNSSIKENTILSAEEFVLPDPFQLHLNLINNASPTVQMGKESVRTAHFDQSRLTAQTAS